MSKHMWRGMSEGRDLRHVTNNLPYREWANCTIIEDESCFPVKEAMRLCRLVATKPTTLTLETHKAAMSYIGAVAKMKARKGKK